MKTISEAAKNNVPIGEDSFFHYSDQDIWIDGFKNGAKFAQRWIPVEEELPIDRKLCIVKDCNNEYRIMIGEHIINWTYPFIEKGYITHWRPIEFNL